MIKLFYKIMYKFTMNHPVSLYFEDKLYPIKNYNRGGTDESMSVLQERI